MINSLIMDKVETELQAACIDNLDASDTTRAGVVQQGPLQGDPDPDEARISITLHENDPDQLQGLNANPSSWEDKVEEVEIGGAVTWKRRFTVKARCLFVNSQESKLEARRIAAAVRTRIERTLMGMDFSSVLYESEYVSRGVFSTQIFGEILQAGGPDAYDFHIKVRFEVLSTTGV
jgi:hypothetical protein